MINEEKMRKEALRLAGAMADMALAVVGGQGLNGRVAPACLLSLSARSVALQRAIEAYNEHIIKWSQETP